jgi:D-3-phosphoglycerate dehydrogenase/(S)-sulfolactate dehydrogenase
VQYAGEAAEAPLRPLGAAVLHGMLAQVVSASVNAVNALSTARERGITVVQERVAGAQDYASLVTVTVSGQGGDVVVAGTIFGGRYARIVRVNRYDLEAVPEGNIILCENDDAPGVVGNIGTVLGAAGVNIARISLARDEGGGGAVSLINVDSQPADEVLTRLRALPHVREVRRIRL